MVSKATLGDILNNIYRPSWAAVPVRSAFPWHRQAHSPRSSQALAISAFGWLCAIEQAHRDSVLNVLAQDLHLPPSSNWKVTVEWEDPFNLMQEKGQKTQIDVAAYSDKAFIAIECKFTEDQPGDCKQTKSCSGSYCIEPGSKYKTKHRCALTSKGIRYWEIVPEIIGIRADVDYEICPFANEWYQLMRNCVISHEFSRALRLIPAFILVYHKGFPMEKFVDGKKWQSYQELVQSASRLTIEALDYGSVIELMHKGLIQAGANTTVIDSLKMHIAAKVSQTN